jgi:hypothetical protein
MPIKNQGSDDDAEEDVDPLTPENGDQNGNRDGTGDRS